MNHKVKVCHTQGCEGHEPPHVVWLRCYQFIFVDLDIENLLSIIITRYQYTIVDLDSYIFFLFSFYHHSFILALQGGSILSV